MDDSHDTDKLKAVFMNFTWIIDVKASLWKRHDMANKHRKRAPKRVANGTFTHRLSGLIFCADCGSRLSYSAPPYSKIMAGTARDSESNYQCSNYRNRYHACFNHY